MVRIRIFEETLVEIYMEGKTPAFDIAAGPVPGEMHLSAGQEPVAAGVCAHLRPTDAITATHRPHHQALAHGVDMKMMAAEIFGKETGLGHGKGGHMHLFSDGARLRLQRHRRARASRPPSATRWPSRRWAATTSRSSFFGEGAANQGAFHESLNLAALWDLGVVFVCEDNAWAISVPKETATAIANNSDRAAAYGIPGVLIPDNDPVAVYEAAGEAVARARRGAGPSLIEVKTDRLLGPLRGRPAALPHQGADRRSSSERDAIRALRGAPRRVRRDERAGGRRGLGRLPGRGGRGDRSSPAARPAPAPESALDHVFA